MNEPKLYDFKIRSGAKEINFIPWYGELGWEIMTWVPFCRKLSLNYDRVIASSFAEMAPLYEDFVTEFRPHNGQNRSLDYPKMYKVQGIHHRYGQPQNAQICQEVLIHARGIRRKSSINYRQWPQLAERISGMALTSGFIGSQNDQYVAGFFDFRGIDLQKLMNRMARAKLVIGCSSGIMHLAAACGTNLVVWGDDRTYFWETLERRYKVTWNPFNVKVGWITANDWQPEPEEITKKIEEIL